MTEQNLTVLIRRSGGAGYNAKAPGVARARHGDTMIEALKGALSILPEHPLAKDIHDTRPPDMNMLITWQSRSPHDANPLVKVQKGTVIRAEELIGLLLIAHRRPVPFEALPVPWLDLEECILTGIDLSPASLDALAAPHNVCWYQTRGIKLQGVGLRGAWLFGARLEGAVLLQTDLSKSNLSFADLRRAVFSGAEMEGADVSYADLREADLREAATLQRISWSNVRLEETAMYRRQIQPIAEDLAATHGREGTSYRTAMETYVALKANFLTLGNYEDAAWAYVKEQQMEKASFFPTILGKSWLSLELGDPPPHSYCCSLRSLRYRCRSAWLHARLFARGVPRRWFEPEPLEEALRILGWDESIDRPRWLRNWAYELLTGYGERPQMPVLWGVVTIAAFTLVFLLAGNVASAPDAVPSRNFVDALTHSIAAFATIGFNALQPVGWGARLLTAVESMLGIGFFALLIYTLGNRMSRS